jgi:hypothetical protein
VIVRQLGRWNQQVSGKKNHCSEAMAHHNSSLRQLLVDASENHGLYRVSVFDAFANIYCDQIARSEAACDLHLVAIVIAECTLARWIRLFRTTGT